MHRCLLQRLREHIEEVRRLTAGLDEAALSKYTLPDKWSLKELIAHLRRVQQVFEQRIVAVLTEENPAIASYDPDQDRDFQELLRRPAKETWSWHHKDRHPEYPGYDVHFQAGYMAHHEAHHLYQMYERRLALGALPPCPETNPGSVPGVG